MLMYSPNTARVLASVFSIGVPVKPMNEAFGNASCRCRARPGLPELQVVLAGVFQPRRFLDLIRHFIVFEDLGGALAKKIAGYHQFHAVNVAVEETLRAANSRPRPRRRPEPILRAIAPAASRETSGSGSSGTRRVRARA